MIPWTFAGAVGTARAAPGSGRHRRLRPGSPGASATARSGAAASADAARFTGHSGATRRHLAARAEDGSGAGGAAPVAQGV